MQTFIHWNGKDIELPLDFLAWLNVFFPEWQFEYTGVIYGLYAAYMAGKEYVKCQL